MVKSIYVKLAGLAVALAASVGVAQASDVNWSVGVGVPGVVVGVGNSHNGYGGYGGYRVPPPVYYAPPPVYYRPPPVYYAPPRPIYYSAPPVYYAPPAYYGHRHKRDRDRYDRHGRHDHNGHGGRHDNDWRR